MYLKWKFKYLHRRFKIVFLTKAKTIIRSKAFQLVFLLIAMYFVSAPFIPEITYQVRDKLPIKYEDEKLLESDKEPYELKIEGNRLIIPEIGVNINIVEGQDESVLSQGAWRRPKTSTPEKGGNTVITGHRFQYLPPNNKTFYNLNKLKEGSKVFVYWKDKKYTYTVKEIFIVKPTELSIEKPLPGNILTLYTCHPLWTADERLVVRADLD